MSKTAYQIIHPDSAGEVVNQTEPEDERVWMPQTDQVWFQPLVPAASPTCCTYTAPTSATSPKTPRAPTAGDQRHPPVQID